MTSFRLLIGFWCFLGFGGAVAAGVLQVLGPPAPQAIAASAPAPAPAAPVLPTVDAATATAASVAVPPSPAPDAAPTSSVQTASAALPPLPVGTPAAEMPDPPPAPRPLAAARERTPAPVRPSALARRHRLESPRLESPHLESSGEPPAEAAYMPPAWDGAPSVVLAGPPPSHVLGYYVTGPDGMRFFRAGP
ncbi:MAG: hypothetical protein JOY70_06825 [Acidisphaera sp.]|nr:hypothetical protein [Acidisphaera sp.]